MAIVVDPAPGQRRDDGADQVHDEQRTERARAEIERRGVEQKRGVGEHRDQREQHAEADGEGRLQLRDCAGARVTAETAWRSLGSACRRSRGSQRRQCGGRDQVQQREREEAARQPKASATAPVVARPQKPPTTVPLT